MKTYIATPFYLMVLLPSFSDLNAQSPKSVFTIIPEEHLTEVLEGFDSFTKILDKAERGQINLYKDDLFSYKVPLLEVKNYIYLSDTIVVTDPDNYSQKKQLIHHRLDSIPGFEFSLFIKLKFQDGLPSSGLSLPGKKLAAWGPVLLRYPQSFSWDLKPRFWVSYP